MSGHFPFAGLATRIGVFGFFEQNNLSLELQEQYYKWWYDWAKDVVQRDPDLNAAKGSAFASYPYGQHAHANFHLHDYYWATALLDLGQLIENVILPRLDPTARQQLEQDHLKMLQSLLAQRAAKPRPAAPDIGRYRHV